MSTIDPNRKQPLHTTTGTEQSSASQGTEKTSKPTTASPVGEGAPGIETVGPDGKQKPSMSMGSSAKPELDAPDLKPGTSQEAVKTMFQDAFTKLQGNFSKMPAAEQQNIMSNLKAANGKSNEETAREFKEAVDAEAKVLGINTQDNPSGSVLGDSMGLRLLKLMIIISKMVNTRTETQGREIEFLNNLQANKTILATRTELAKAEKEESGKTAQTVGKIFAWVGAGVLAVVAVAALILTGGSAAPLAVAALITIAVLVLDETGAMQKITEGLADFLVNSFGMDRTAAMIVAMVTIAVAIILIQLGLAAATGGAAAGGLAQTFSALEKITKAIPYIIAASGFISGLGQGTTQIVAGYYKSEAEHREAEAEEYRGESENIQFFQDQITKILESLVKFDENSTKILSDILKDFFTSQKTHYKNI